MSCGHDCNQGRNCRCRQAGELPITMLDEEFPQLDWVLHWLWTGMAWLGFFGMVALISFVWGYGA